MQPANSILYLAFYFYVAHRRDSSDARCERCHWITKAMSIKNELQTKTTQFDNCGNFTRFSRLNNGGKVPMST
jgi:hypothetical protein